MRGFHRRDWDGQALLDAGTEVVVDFFDGLVPGTILATIPVPGGGGAGLEDTGTAGARKPCSDIRTTPGNALYAACRTVGSCIANMRFGRL